MLTADEHKLGTKARMMDVHIARPKTLVIDEHNVGPAVVNSNFNQTVGPGAQTLRLLVLPICPCILECVLKTRKCHCMHPHNVQSQNIHSQNAQKACEAFYKVPQSPRDYLRITYDRLQGNHCCNRRSRAHYRSRAN